MTVLCEYCDIYLTHDTEQGRRQHKKGKKHQENVRQYYAHYLQTHRQYGDPRAMTFVPLKINKHRAVAVGKTQPPPGASAAPPIHAGAGANAGGFNPHRAAGPQRVFIGGLPSAPTRSMHQIQAQLAAQQAAQALALERNQEHSQQQRSSAPSGPSFGPQAMPPPQQQQAGQQQARGAGAPYQPQPRFGAPSGPPSHFQNKQFGLQAPPPPQHQHQFGQQPPSFSGPGRPGAGAASAQSFGAPPPASAPQVSGAIHPSRMAHIQR